MTKACAITGHRFASLPFGTNEGAESCRALKRAITDAMIELVELSGVREFLCGMALGSDQICAEIVLGLKSQYPDLKLSCWIPCAEQSKKWNQAQKMRYQQILRLSDEVVCLSDHSTPDCMRIRNETMVDRADFLLAIWNGKPRGGTAATVRYAKSRALPIVLIDPFSV